MCETKMQRSLMAIVTLVQSVCSLFDDATVCIEQCIKLYYTTSNHLVDGIFSCFAEVGTLIPIQSLK